MPPPKTRKRLPTRTDKIDQTQPAYIVLDKWGGQAAFCRDTGWPASTVHGWLVSGFIPQKRQTAILELSAKLKKRVRPADFVARPGAN